MQTGSLAVGVLITGAAAGLGYWLYKDLTKNGKDAASAQMAGIDYNSNVSDAYVAQRVSQMKEFQVRKRLGL